jgi:RHS repeat-associated protein
MSGIGGLLLVKEPSTTHIVGYDGNENVTSLTDGNGSITASYEYGPFGEPLKIMGSYAATNAFTFSSRYTDRETNVVYFGHRYYDPQLGRWVSEDPVEERGRKALTPSRQREEGSGNPYSYVENKSLDALDATGLYGRIIYQNRSLLFFLRGTAEQLAADHALLRLPTSFDQLVMGTLKLLSSLDQMLEDRTLATMRYPSKNTGKRAKYVPLAGFTPGVDERGHIIGRQLGGSGDVYNLFPQSRVLNHSPNFRGFEDSLRQYQDSHQCCSARIEVNMYYAPLSRRPLWMSYDVRFYNLSQARLLKKFDRIFLNVP